jgi:hypothetical protein
MIQLTTHVVWSAGKWILWFLGWKSREDCMQEEIRELRKEVDFLKANSSDIEMIELAEAFREEETGTSIPEKKEK